MILGLVYKRRQGGEGQCKRRVGKYGDEVNRCQAADLIPVTDIGRLFLFSVCKTVFQISVIAHRIREGGR